MTTLTQEVEQDWSQSPRVTVVKAPRTEFLAQDVVDTLRKVEDTFRGMSESKLIDASGKQSIGGGNSVGITYALFNDQVQFEDRQTPAQTGTITTGSVAAVGGLIQVIDASATFQTNNVARGSFIINWTDQSIVSVQTVVSETELKVRVPTSGIGNTYDISDAYSVFNVELCDLTGGNATAVDTDGVTPIDVAVPSVGTYLVLTLSSSATISEGLAAAAITDKIDDIHGQIRRSIFIDTSLVAAGTGYQDAPYNNVTTAIDDAEANGITSLVFLDDATLDRQLRNFDISGIGDPTIDVDGQDVTGSRFTNLQIDGTLIGRITASRCTIRNNVAGLEGKCQRCGLAGDVTMAIDAELLLEHCFSEIGGTSTPSVSMNALSTTAELSVRLYSGGIEVRDSQAPGNNCTVEVPAGRIKLAASNTDGTISVRGTADLDDTSGAGVTVDKEPLLWPKKLLTIQKFLGLK